MSQNIYAEKGLEILNALTLDTNPFPIKLDVNGLPVIPEIVLCNRNKDRINVIENVSSFKQSFNFLEAHEVSFDVSKQCGDTVCTVWDELTDFRIIYIPQHKLWYEIYITEKDDNGMTKSISGTHLEEAELSSVNLYGIEINSEDDLEAHNYVPTTFYNESDPSISLLDRLLDKIPHYSIIHVDESLMQLQRCFSFDDKSIGDAFDEIAEECECLFVYGEHVDDDGYSIRTISVYDMLDYCEDCHERGEFDDGVCTECSSSNITPRYGEDTRIFISNENIANEITHTQDTDSVKNCFHLEAGDDLMTATIASCNMGNSYLWYMPEETRLTMTPELLAKLVCFDADSIYYADEYAADIDVEVMCAYNELVYKYRAYDEDISTILDCTGYQSLVEAYYNSMDFEEYLQTSLMPAKSTDDTSADEQCAYLISENMSPIGVKDSSTISLTTADSSVKSYAKVYVDSSKYKIEITSSSISGNIWSGIISLTSYSDEDDKASTSLSVTFNNDIELFTKQKIDKLLAKEDDVDDSYGVVNLFSQEYDDFIIELKRYSLDNLDMFYQCGEDAINVLIEDGHYSSQSDLYESMYIPYLNKVLAILSEIALRESEITSIQNMESAISSELSSVAKRMSLETYLGDCWEEYISYRREDSYENSNFISDGLTNASLVTQALLFLKAAKREIKKSATLLHSITTTLKNLLIIPEFKSIIYQFKLGNWIRVKIDGTIYKLRLASYEIDYSNIDDIDVTFTDIRDLNMLIAQIRRTFAQSKGISSSYSSTARQMVSNNNILSTSTGVLIKSADEGGESGQLRILANGIYYTTDKWSTVLGVCQNIAQALDKLSLLIAGSNGVYTTEETQPDGSIIYYLHDSVNLEESKNVWKMTSNAFAVSSDGGQTWNAGLTVDGEMITQILDTVGINANWINTGALNIYKNDGTLIFHAGQDGTDDDSDSSVYINADLVKIGALTIDGDSQSITLGQTIPLSVKLSKDVYQVSATSSSGYIAFPEDVVIDINTYYGRVNVTNGCLYVVTTTTGVDCTFDQSSHKITVHGLSDYLTGGKIDVKATYLDGVTDTATFNILKSSTSFGITAIKNYYATSSSQTQAPQLNTDSVVNWYTKTPQLSAGNRFLWAYEEVHYSDGTVESTEKRVIGVYGELTLNVTLSNDNETISCDLDGKISLFPDGVNTVLTVYYGNENVTVDSLINYDESGLSGKYDIDMHTYTVTGIDDDVMNGHVTFTITYNSISIVKVFSVNKVREVVGESSLYVVVSSSNGNMFRSGNIFTTLTCNVYYGTTDVTDKVTKFTWSKTNADGTVDSTWNREMSNNVINLTSADVFNKASFNCSVEIDL